MISCCTLSGAMRTARAKATASLALNQKTKMSKMTPVEPKGITTRAKDDPKGRQKQPMGLVVPAIQYEPLPQTNPVSMLVR